MKPLLIIPAYNEAENIINVVENLKSKCPGMDYIIVKVYISTKKTEYFIKVK